METPEFHWQRVSFEITRDCNLHCKICDHPVLARREKALAAQWVTGAIFNASQLGVKQVVISGGEPLLHKGLSQIAAAAKKARIQLTLVTNGTLLTPKLTQGLIADGVNRFIISLNGPQAQDEYIRGKGTYDRTMRSIRYLVESGNAARLVVNITICRRNFDSLDSFSNALQQIGVRKITYNIFSPDFLVQYRNQKENEFALTREQLLQAGKYFTREDPGEPELCPHVLESCVVENDGIVSPCWGHRGRFKIQETPLNQILECEAYVTQTKRLSRTCRRCFLACYNLGR